MNLLLEEERELRKGGRTPSGKNMSEYKIDLSIIFIQSQCIALFSLDGIIHNRN